MSVRWLLLLFSCSVVSSSFWPHGLQRASLPCPSPSSGSCSNSCPLSQWCHPTILSSVSFFCLQSFPASGSRTTGSVAVVHELSCCGMWDLPSPGSGTHVPCIGRWTLNRWTTREAPRGTYIYIITYLEPIHHLLMYWPFQLLIWYGYHSAFTIVSGYRQS